MYPNFYVNQIQNVLEEAMQHGIWAYFEKESKNVISSYKKIASTTGIDVDEIKMEQLSLIFFNFVISISFSLSVLIIEIVWVNTQNK